MTTKEKAARAGTRTASDTTFDKVNSTPFDPVKGWHSLGQEAKDRQQKKVGKEAKL